VLKCYFVLYGFKINAVHCSIRNGCSFFGYEDTKEVFVPTGDHKVSAKFIKFRCTCTTLNQFRAVLAPFGGNLMLSRTHVPWICDCLGYLALLRHTVVLGLLRVWNDSFLLWHIRRIYVAFSSKSSLRSFWWRVTKW